MATIVLAGGESRRFGHPKSEILFGGQTLLARACESFPDAIIQSQEEPRFGGPVAAIAAALAHVNDVDVAIVAVDAPFASTVLAQLELGSADAVVPLDVDGRPQWLCARYRTPALRRALAELGSPVGRSMKHLAEHLDVTFLNLGGHARWLVDIDTPEQLQLAQELLDEPVTGPLDHP